MTKLSLDSNSLSHCGENVTNPKIALGSGEWPGYCHRMRFWTDDGIQEGGTLVVLLTRNLFTQNSPLTTLGVSACMQPATWTAGVPHQHQRGNRCNKAFKGSQPSSLEVDQLGFKGEAQHLLTRHHGGLRCFTKHAEFFNFLTI